MVRVAIALTVLLVLAPVGSFFAWRYVQASAIRSDIEYARGEMEDLSRPFTATWARYERSEMHIPVMAEGWSLEETTTYMGLGPPGTWAHWFGKLPGRGRDSWLAQLWPWQAGFGGAMIGAVAVALALVRRPVGWRGLGAAVVAASLRVVLAVTILVPVVALLVLSWSVWADELIGRVLLEPWDWIKPVRWSSVRFIGVAGGAWGTIGAARAVAAAWRSKCAAAGTCAACGYPRLSKDAQSPCSECGLLPPLRVQRTRWQRLVRSPDAYIGLGIVLCLATGLVVASTDTYWGRWLSRERPSAWYRWTALHFLPGQGVCVGFREGCKVLCIEASPNGEYTMRLARSFHEYGWQKLTCVKTWDPPIEPVERSERGWRTFSFGDGRYFEVGPVTPDKPGGPLVIKVLDAISIDRWAGEDFRGPWPLCPEPGRGAGQN